MFAMFTTSNEIMTLCTWSRAGTARGPQGKRGWLRETSVRAHASYISGTVMGSYYSSLALVSRSQTASFIFGWDHGKKKKRSGW